MFVGAVLIHGGRKILHSNNYRFDCVFVLEYYSN